MVWGLFPAESVPGEQKYFFFSKGTYKVGRKGCDVIINTDKGVSRVHAEIVVDEMISMDLQNRSTSVPSKVHIKDCSKYGTFINNKQGSKMRVHEYPDKKTTLNDGDVVSFGTGNGTYRFSYVPLVFFLYCSKTSEVNQLFEDKIVSVGARTTHSWSAECTHVLVDQSMPVKEELIDAILAQKPVVLNNWVEVVVEKNIRTEIPNCAFYAPTLTLEGMPIKIAEPNVQEKCLAAYTFLLGSLHLYKFQDRLQLLLEVGGAKVQSIDGYCSSSQASEDGESDRVVLVTPAVSINEFDRFHHLRSLCRATDVSLICAVLSGHLDPSTMKSPSKLISSSCSTDETIVADSDVEADTVTSNQMNSSDQSDKVIKDEIKEISRIYVDETSEKVCTPSFNNTKGSTIARIDNVDEPGVSGNENSDIIYSQDLIIRDTNVTASDHSTTNNGVVNFKCFRKRATQSGNSFSDLIPFSKYPYKESDYGSEEVSESVKEEKKRKQIEAIAEDLFNSEKVKRRAGSGSSLHGLLTRGGRG